MFLKQSTAAQSRLVGPFVSDTDFKTVQTGLTIANTDVKLSANGAAGANKNSGGGTHRNNGMYALTFDATDTATVGELTGSVVVAGALPVAFKFFVVEEAVYDAWYAASAVGYITDQPVNATKWNGLTTVALPLIPTTAGRTLDVSAGGEAGVDWANVGSPTTANALTGTTIAVTQKVDVDTIKTNPVVNGGTITFPTTATLASTTNITAGTVTTATNVTTVNGLAANVITATSIASGALTAAKFAANALDAVWSTAARVLTAGTNIVLAKGTGVTGFNDITAADVNAEVVDCLNVDTYAEIGQETPAATQTIRKMIAYGYKAWRNRSSQTATAYKLYNDDATTVGQKSTVSDDGTTFESGEKATGP